MLARLIGLGKLFRLTYFESMDSKAANPGRVLPVSWTLGGRIPGPSAVYGEPGLAKDR
jgi:hypothetical protein